MEAIASGRRQLESSSFFLANWPAPRATHSPARCPIQWPWPNGLWHNAQCFHSTASSASANDTTNGSPNRDKTKTTIDANAPWGHSGNLKEGTSPEGKGR
eukprot:scaffold27044_cov204-Isochrysis_galbana.AAC.1